jgi:ABC-2 type transport system ATP-binding protein
MPAPQLEARDLHKRFGRSGPAQVHAVRGVSLAIERGRCFGLLGPNGAGKTTTIEMLEGISTPDSGEVLFEGAPLGKLSRQHCGIQFQHTALPDFLTVREVLRFFSGLYESHAPIEELVERCRLAEFLDRDTHLLSGGQRQRVLLAVALVNRPRLLFLDEPTTGLDPQARRNFWELVREIKAAGTTVLLTTHYMEEAYELCDEIAIMDQGKVIAQGSPASLLKAHFDAVAVVLPASDYALGAGRIGDLKAVPIREGLLEIQTTSVDHTVRAFIDAGIPLQRIRIREQTLEDLFLALTGKGLRA